MEKTLQFYIYVDGVNDAPFPNSTQQAVLYEYKYDATRMGNAPIISGTIMHPSCLDELWDDNRVYVTFKGEKYFINQKPSSSYSNEDARYKHEVQLVSERSILNEVYFYDVVSGDTTSDKYFSNSADVVFYGDISELAKRLNYALSWAKLDYTVVVDSGIKTDAQLVSFQNKFISDVLNDSYNLFKVPYYFVGKTIHLGYTNNVIDTTFKYGADNSLLSIAKNYSSDRIINRATGLGSSDNIPYYYPNFDPKGVSEAILNNSNNESVVIVNKRKYQKVKLGDVFTYQRGDSYTFDYIDRDKYSILEGFEKDKPSDEYPNEEPNYYIVVDYPFTVDIYHDTVINLEYDKAWFKGINARLYRNNELWERYNQLGSFYNYRLYEGDYHFTITLEVKLTDGRESFTDEDIPEVLDALQVSITTQISGYQQWVLNKNSNVVKLEDYGLEMKVEPKNGDTITFKQLSYIPPQPNLMPSIYRETLGNNRFYNALNNTYLNPNNNEYYVFPNPYLEGAPKEQIQDFEDIKPTIKGITNDSGLRIDMFSEFAYDTNDNDEFDEEGNYLHPYFFGKLRKFDGTYGFNLFDHSIDEAEMSVSMTSGSCGGCEFIIGVDDKTQKNIVQVDENGNLLRDSSGNVLYGSPQDRQNDTQNYEVWIALKKDINTFGVIMPNATSNYKPSSGDTFVILHIDLPDAYIIAAEKKLEQEIIRYIYENNSNKYNLSIAFSRIYLANNPSIANALNENAQLKVEYNNNIYTLYISSFSYNRSSDSALPEIRVELSQELGIKKTSLPQQVAQTKATLNNKIAKASQEVATTKNEVAQTKATVQESSNNLTSKVENLEQLIRTQQGDTADLKDSASAWTLDEQTTKARTTSKVLRTKYNVAIDNMLSLNEISDVGATLKDILESIGKWNELWQLDEDNNAIYTPLNLIVEGTLAMGNLGEGGGEAPVAGLQKVSITIQNYDNPFVSDAFGNVTLPAYPTALKNPYALIINGVHYDGSKEITINLEGGGGIADSVAWENVMGRPTALSEFENDLEFVTYATLNGYATQSWVGDNYLSRSGGTLSNSVWANQLNLNAIGTTAGLRFSIDGVLKGILNVDEYQTLRFQGAQEYEIIHSGNIGSQTVESATKLVNGTTNVVTTTTTGRLFDISSYSIYERGVLNDGTHNYYQAFGSANGGVVSVLQAGTTISLKTSNTDRVVIDSSGNVIIGATNDNNSGAILQVDGAISTTAEVKIGGLDVLRRRDAKFCVGEETTVYASQPTSIYGTSISFLTSYADERMRVADNGNILIGTTTDSGYKLDVNGSIRGTSLKIGDAELVWDSTNQALKIVGNAYVTKAFSMGELTESGSGGGGAAGLGSVTVRVNGQDYITDASGIVTIPDYLPLSGGTIEGGSGIYTPLTIKNINLSEVWIGFQDAYGTCYIGSSNGVPSVNMGADNKTLIHTGNYDDYALPLSGGTITGWLTIKASGYPLIEFKAGDTTRGYYGFSGTGVAAIWDTKDWQTLIHSGNYSSYALPLSGGTLTGNLALSNSYLQLWSDSKLYGFNVSASSGEPIYLKNDAWYTLYHTGNFNPANYLPLSGGVIDGSLQIGTDANTSYNYLKLVRNGTYMEINCNEYGGYINYNSSALRLQSGTITYEGNTLLHSGNYSNYALPLSGGTITGDANAPLSINGGGDWAGIGYFINGSKLGYLGIWSDQRPVFIDATWNVHTLIHSGNIGSQSVNHAYSASTFPCELNNGWDANANKAILLSDYGSGNPRDNMPSDFGFGSVFTPLPANGAIDLLGQFAWDINHNTSTPTRKLWFRASNNLGWGNDWKQIAFTDSNVASATKLQTARTIWGQSFDGTGGVSGEMYAVSTIRGSYPIAPYIRSADTPENVGNLGCAVGIGSAPDNYGTFFWGEGSGNGHIQVGRKDGSVVAYNLCLQEFGGNVLIGTTSDNGAKMRVYGSIWADEAITSTSAIRTLFYGTATCGLYPNTWISSDGVNNRLWLYNDNQLALYGSEIQLRNNTSISGNLTVTGSVTIKGSGNYASTPLYVESTNVSYVGVALKAGTRGDVGALRYYEALGVGLINVETNAEIAVSDIPYFTTDAGATRYAIPTLNRDNSLSIQTTSMSRYLNFGSAPFSWSGSYTYPLIWSSADKENTGDVWVMIAMPHIPYLEKDKRGYTGTTWGARIRFEANTTSGVVWDIGTASDDTFSIVRDGNYVFNIFGGGNAAYGGTVEISKYSWDGTLVVGKDGKDKAVIGYCGSTTNGVVFGGHNSGLSQWAPVNVSGSAVYLRHNETIVLDVTNARVGITGNLAVTGDITSEGTIAMAKLASSSDAKLKENIKWLSADRAMGVVRALRPTEWDWKKDRTHSFGFIAQDVQPIIPEMVSSVNDTLRLEYNQLHAFEIGAIQHIDSEVETLKRRVNELENELKQYRRNA